MYTREGPVSLQKYRGAHERLGGSPKQETVDMTLDVSCTIDDGIDPDVENKTRPPTAFNMPSRGPCRSDAEPRYETKILCEFPRAPFRKRPTELRGDRQPALVTRDGLTLAHNENFFASRRSASRVATLN